MYRNPDAAETVTDKGQKQKDKAVMTNSNNHDNNVNEINIFGDESFDPQLQIEVKDEGFFDSNTALSIVEEGENVFVLWKSGDGFFNKSGLNGSLNKYTPLIIKQQVCLYL